MGPRLKSVWNLLISREEADHVDLHR